MIERGPIEQRVVGSMHSTRTRVALAALVCAAAGGTGGVWSGVLPSRTGEALAAPLALRIANDPDTGTQADELDEAQLQALAMLESEEAQPADANANAEPATSTQDKDKTKTEPKFDARGRRIQPDEPTVLAFKNVSVEQVVPFIVEATGKVVLPQPDVLSRRITILNDQPLPRSRALDYLILALHQYGIGVVETKDMILLRDVAEIDKQDVPVIGPDESLLKRTDTGAIVEKVFAVRRGSAQNIYELIKGSLPSFAKLAVEPESNQLVVMANIGLLQRLERLINSLDQPAAAALSTETYFLRYADAEQIATNIKDLYAQSQQGRTGNNQNPFAQFFNRGGGGGPGGGNNNNNRPGGQGNQRSGGQGAQDASTSANLRVTSNVQQNSVTVLAEKSVLEQVRKQISDNWDRPLASEAVVPRVFELRNTDPVKVKELLTTLFGNPGQTGTGGQQNAQQGQSANRLFGQFTFEAIPEAGRLVVVAKSPENLSAIAKIIEDLDQPQTAGLPQIVELKHASAEELAEQLNALLSQEGTLAQITRAETGLTSSSTSASPFASNQSTTTGTTGNNNNQNNTQPSPGSIQFWWQRARPPTNNAGSSNLVSKIRIVPVWRQNSLLILSPPEYSHSLVSLVESLDHPGRQVLLSAVIAEINVEDATALGLRWSNSPINPTNQDNAISVTAGPNAAGTGTATSAITGTKNDLLPSLFDTSVLNAGVNINLLLQALAQKTAVTILSEPRIFTSDNQQAEFFSGQDIPFITNSQQNTVGNLVQTFDYRAVGIALRVRPRITVKRDVDLRINLELSSIQPNQTLFGGYIVDRRETTTQLIVGDGQTVVVSGILRSEDSDIKRKVPLLGDIPLIGALFTSTDRSKNKTELVAFVTPYVVGSSDDSNRVNEKDRERLGEIRQELRPTTQLDRKIVEGEKAGDKNSPAAPEKNPSDSGSTTRP